MTTMFNNSSFKQPSNLPQDLLLIQELIADTTLDQRPKPEGARSDSDSDSDSSSDSDISSSAESSSDSDGEVELVEGLLIAEGPNDISITETTPTEAGPVGAISSPSSSEESSDDSESDDEPDNQRIRAVLDKFVSISDSEDEGAGAGPLAGSALRSKNEVQEPEIVVPDITEVDESEQLEKVGTVMSIIENAVVVKGIPSQLANRAAERALDSESLLVFEDRKVLGFTCETFGPTSMPMYQVRFRSSSAIDREIITIGRDVFHVPTRSKFIFTSQLARLKGSDASNVHDEEVGADELEFSDDEAEAAYKRQFKRKRDGRRDSVSSFQSSSSNPSHLRDQEMNEEAFSTSAFGQYSPYDLDLNAGPSTRNAPLPYDDDPYQDVTLPLVPGIPSPSSLRSPGSSIDHGRPRGGRERGRGRGRGRDFADRGRGRGRGGRGGPSSQYRGHSNGREQNFRPVTPNAPELSWAEGNYGNANVQPTGPFQHYGSNAAWHAPPPQNFYQHQQSQQSAQPHINPRFFGFNMGFTPGQEQFGSPRSQAYGSENFYVGPRNANWAGSWTQSDQQNQGGANGGGNMNDEYVPQ